MTLELAVVLEELITHESTLNSPEFGTALADFDRMMAHDFWEVGASGKVYDCASTLDLLEERPKTPQQEHLQPSDFRIRKLSHDVYLLHYNLMRGRRKTRRTTVWERSEGDWRIVFHQGTVVQE